MSHTVTTPLLQPASHGENGHCCVDVVPLPPDVWLALELECALLPASLDVEGLTLEHPGSTPSIRRATLDGNVMV